MPQDTTTPASTGSVDRLSLSVTAPRGHAESATTGACGSGCALCFCGEAESDAAAEPSMTSCCFCPCACCVGCFEAES